MKRAIALCMALMFVLLFVSCSKEKAAIPVDKLHWSISEGTNEGHRYVYFQVTNNSDVAILGLWMTFRIRDSVSQPEREEFIQALQDSQGFDDAFMQTFLTNLAQNGGELTMTAVATAPLQPRQSADPIQCYYMGGWTSKDLIYLDHFEPKSLTVSYEQDGTHYEQTYDFKTETYAIAPIELEQK